jgi:uncharacterized protein (DUF433 family)
MSGDAIDRIVIRPGYCGGRPHIAGHRVKVKHVAVYHDAGLSPEEIVAALLAITLDDVHAALAYYRSHRREIEEEIAEEDRLVEELKASSPPSPLRERLGRVMREASDDPFPPG